MKSLASLWQLWASLWRSKQALLVTKSSNKPILLLDVDNTLYQEALYGIEAQIVARIQRYCQSELHLTPEQADDLHQRYGSTIEGLQQTLWHELEPNIQQDRLKHFYDNVYRHVNVTNLLLASKSTSSSTSTGYTHATRQQLQSLSTLSRRYRLHLASNSPAFHVAKVVQALGLTRLAWAGVWTPDRHTDFPTKASPERFFGSLLEDAADKTLMDDSKTALSAAAKYMTGVEVSSSLEETLLLWNGWVSPDFHFSQVEYLRAKNVVDERALHRPTYERLRRELEQLVVSEDPLIVCDIGSGLLSMLRLCLHGSKDLPPLSPRPVDYYAFETNQALELACLAELRRLGFVLNHTHEHMSTRLNVHGQPENDTEQVLVHNETASVVHLCWWKWGSRPLPKVPDVVIGCCLADLMDPVELTRDVLRLTAGGTSATLLYFPITFAGVTQFLPPRPMARGTPRPIPPDTTAFATYSDVLCQEHGHFLDPNQLVDAVADYGGKCMSRGASNWIIDPQQDSYMWQTMLYFFGTVAAPALDRFWDARGWLDRARKHQPTIYVSNVDLLLRIPHLGHWKLPTEPSLSNFIPSTYQEIEFQAPGKVAAVSKKVPTLEPQQVRIKTICSLISSGTELKVFKGDFDDAALDVNIDGMENERMAYPLAYGYCLVGKVVECGSDVEDANDLIGKLVFTFSPHASQVVAARDCLQIVPDGISAEDAVFMPSVESALSLVHEANPRVGESVAVFGQGLVGLLTTAILAHIRMQGEAIPTLTTIDTLPDRLAASAAMGSPQSLLPSEVAAAGPFDVAIEVSGSGRALQSAIDTTRDGGRIIVGSWFGSTPVNLKLGIDFHRSHKTLKAAQVSELPAEMRLTWTKERRFEYAWELVAALRPSRLLTRQVPLSQAQEAYESLDVGKEIAIAFQYG